MHDYSFDTRKYETKTFNENFAKKVRTCRSRKREAKLPNTNTKCRLFVMLMAHVQGLYSEVYGNLFFFGRTCVQKKRIVQSRDTG
jgi:hypothetical protein